MIWLTWRQFRAQGAVGGAALIAFAALLAATGRNLADLYTASGIAGCQGSTCSQVASTFLSRVASQGPYLVVYLIGIAAVLLAPAIIGTFWGVPLVAREIEAGTHYLAWNQSVTRTRWLVIKLCMVGVSAIAVTGAFSLMLAWWAAPIASAVAHGGSSASNPLIAMNQFSALVFATHGITPLGYGAFGFALGVAAGLLVRRTVTGMAIAIAIYAALQVAMPLWIRPNFLPPNHTIATLGSVVAAGLASAPPTLTLTVGGLSSQPGAWILSSGAVNAAGTPISTFPAACLGHPATPPSSKEAAEASTLDCLARQGIRVGLTYQPAGRYWTFQGVETAIYLGLALVLAGYCFRRLNRRLT